MSDAFTRYALRGIAVAIALAAILDPAITSRRHVRPVVLVGTVDSIRDARLASAVVNAIDDHFVVTRAPIAGASAAVIVGDGLPAATDEFPIPTFVVPSDTAAPRVDIERVELPANAAADARIPVTARIAVHGATGRSLEVTLRTGSTIADHRTQRLTRGDSAVAVSLSFVPTSVGAAAVRLIATFSGATAPAIADATVNVQDVRWGVLFFDARPSWTSTFVRRVIERDSRFVVTSRVATSRNVSANTGRPPATLTDRVALSAFDVVVIGAPDAVSPADVAGLDDFMRRRGGSVVLLLDGQAAGPHDRLTSVSKWSSTRTSITTLALARHDSATLRATELAWPAPLPAGAWTIAGGDRPVVWESPVGAGRLVVSGALDAWRFRDSSTSGFEGFWRTVIADVAAAAPPPLAVTISPTIAAPGDPIDVRAVLRDAALREPRDSTTVHASIAAALDSGSSVHLWPTGVGEFEGIVRAPRTVGSHRITVISDVGTASVPLVVSTDVHRATPSLPTLMSAWATAHGGQVIQPSRIGDLAPALRAALRTPARSVTWHPFRSAWWIVPFVLALSGEWWLRRRRGLR